MKRMLYSPPVLDATDVIRLLRSAVEQAGGQSAFARKTHLNRTELNRILHGKRLPTKKTIKALKLRMVFVPGGAGGEWLGCRSTPLLFRQTDRKGSRAKSLLADLSGKAHPVRSCLRARAPSGRRWRAAAPCRSKVLRAFPSQTRNSVPRRSRRPDRLLGTARNRCT